MGKKRKHEEKGEEIDKEETRQQIKSIADLFTSSSTDPALEALFKQNVLAPPFALRLMMIGWTTAAVEEIQASLI